MRRNLGGFLAVASLVATASCGSDDSGGSTTSTTMTASATATTTDGTTSATTGATTSATTGATDSGSATSGATGSSGTGTTGGVSATGPKFDVGNSGTGTAGGGDNICSGDLQSVIDSMTGDLVMQCPPEEGCHDGMCVPACEAAGLSEGSVGCEYITPYPPFYQNQAASASYHGSCHALMIANTWGRPAQLTLERDGVPYDALMHARIPTGVGPGVVYDPVPATGIPVGQVAILFLSHVPTAKHALGASLACPVEPAYIGDAAAHGTDAGIAFELDSDTPVTVYDIVPYGGAESYLPSASLILPTTAWGDNYVLAAPHQANNTQRKWALVVAEEDNTTVTFNTSVTVDAGTITTPPPNTPTMYNLDRGDFIQWASTADMGGGVIASDKDVGVYTGNTYLNVPTADSGGGPQDSSHQQITHVNALASEYVSFGIPTRLQSNQDESVMYRLVGVVDGTTLTYDSATPTGAPVSLDQGQIVEFETRDFFIVTSQDEDYPFIFTQYMSGSISDANALDGCFGSPCSLGDTDWINLVPPAQFLSRYAFFIDPTYGVTGVSIVRTKGPNGFADVKLACMAQAVTGWQAIGTSGEYEVAHVNLHRGGVGGCATSQQEASSTLPFGMTVWGADRDASYGYPAGGNARVINSVIVPAG